MFQRLSRAAIAAGAVTVLAGPAMAASISLTGTVRDFRASHPDFEAVIGGLERGAVAATLDAADKPVLSASGLGSTPFGTQADFAR